VARSVFRPGYVANDALLPLCCGTGDDALTQEDLKDFEPSLLNSVTVGGKVYMALVPDSGTLLYYNTDLFEKAGITPPGTVETAWTWQQVLEALQKVKQEENGQVTVWGSTFRTNPPNQFEGMLFPRSKGAKGSPTFKGISDDGLSVTGSMDTPEAIQGFQFLQDLFVKYKLIPTTNIPDCFETGRCATKIAPADTAAVLGKQFSGLKWGVTPFPYLTTSAGSGLLPRSCTRPATSRVCVANGTSVMRTGARRGSTTGTRSAFPSVARRHSSHPGQCPSRLIRSSTTNTRSLTTPSTFCAGATAISRSFYTSDTLTQTAPGWATPSVWCASIGRPHSGISRLIRCTRLDA
jgi:hypothetical protein